MSLIGRKVEFKQRGDKVIGCILDKYRGYDLDVYIVEDGDRVIHHIECKKLVKVICGGYIQNPMTTGDICLSCGYSRLIH